MATKTIFTDVVGSGEKDKDGGADYEVSDESGKVLGEVIIERELYKNGQPQGRYYEIRDASRSVPESGTLAPGAAVDEQMARHLWNNRQRTDD